MADPVEDLLLAVARLCRVFGLTPRRLEIFVHEGPDKDKPAISLPVTARFITLEQPPPEVRQPPPVPRPQQSPPVEEDSAAIRDRAACVADIIAMLESKGFPLTETRILSELSRAGKKWSLGLVVKCLRDMAADGTVENPADAKPRGYRLPPEPQSEEEEN